MKIEDLTTKIEEFKLTQDKIQKNREIWTSQTKPILIETLGKIKEKFDLEWHVQILDEVKNSEGVNITFGFKRSGFKSVSDKTMRSYLKKGGTIVFSQAYNGEIFVIILYPFVEEFVSESDNKLLGKFDPLIINEDFIVEKVSTFIDEMIKWEKSTFYNRVGFKKN